MRLNGAVSLAVAAVAAALSARCPLGHAKQLDQPVGHGVYLTAPCPTGRTNLVNFTGSVDRIMGVFEVQNRLGWGLSKLK